MGIGAQRKPRLKIEKIKSYPRFTLYQVYKIENNKKIPVYKTCYTDLQLKEIKRKQLAD